MSADEYTQEDRRKCEIRLHKLLAWVGVQYPKNLDVQGKNIKIREFIFDLITKNRLSSKDLKEIKILLHTLQEIKLRKEKELETMKLTISEGRQLCDEMAGLIRAVDTLKDLLKMREKGEFYQKSKENRIRRDKRWIKYLEKLKK
ncbi:MAG: DUF5788 family protein [Methanobacteriota archaeon]